MHAPGATEIRAAEPAELLLQAFEIACASEFAEVQNCFCKPLILLDLARRGQSPPYPLRAGARARNARLRTAGKGGAP